MSTPDSPQPSPATPPSRARSGGLAALVLAAVVLLGSMAAIVVGAAQPASRVGPPTVGERVPDFSLRGDDGRRWTLDDVAAGGGAWLVFDAVARLDLPAEARVVHVVDGDRADRVASDADLILLDVDGRLHEDFGTRPGDRYACHVGADGRLLAARTAGD